MAQLPKIGLHAIIEGSPAFISMANAIDKATQKIGESTLKTSVQMSNTWGKIEKAVGKGVAATVKHIGILVTALSVGLLGAITAVIGIFKGLFDLMGRGATFQGVIDSFERLTDSVGLSASALLNDLRRAAGYTIPDLELLRLSNVALAGATGEFGREFGENLPRLLEIARAQARATGQDIDFLFNSLITGIKRGSPLLIDNTGLVLKVEEANQRYAESIGKTVEQLTAQERQIALLRATLEAGGAAIENFAGIQETAADKMARFGAHITNIFDTISIQLQPIFRMILDIVNTILSGISNLLESAGPYIAALVQMIVNALRPIFQTVSDWADTMNSTEAARSFFTGAANTFGSFLRAVVEFGTRIINAVAQIAKAIASFLLGSSPPPEGPLSRMTEGAAATMKAWLEGFTGVSLDPVKKVAAQVSNALGSINKLNMQQVEIRLLQLDKALLPFQQRLELVRAQFEAISAPINAALDNIDRQMNTAVNALKRGEAGSAELVRSLDAQRQQLERTLAREEEQLANAELQLALAEAQQQAERTRLELRQQQLELEQRIAEARKRQKPEGALTPEEKKKKKAAGEGGGAGEEPAGGGGGGAGELPETPGGAGLQTGTPLDNLFSFKPAEVKAAGAEMSAAFMEGFGEGTMGALESAQTDLGSASELLSQAWENLPARIDAIGQSISNSIRISIIQPIEVWFREAGRHFDSTEFGTFAYQIATLPTRFQAWLGGIASALVQENARIANAIQVGLVNPIQVAIQDAKDHFDPTIYGSFAYYLQTLPTRITTWLASVGENFRLTFVVPIEDFINENVAPLFAGPEEPRSLSAKFLAFINGLENTFGTLRDTFHRVFVAPIDAIIEEISHFFLVFFESLNPGSLRSIINAAINFLESVPALIGEAFSTIGSFVVSTFVVPIVNAINSVLAAFEHLLNELREPVANIMEQFGASIGPLPGFGAVGDALTGGANIIRNLPPVSLGRVPVPGAATGGIFGPGLLRVGERGEELLANGAQRLAVFPNQMLRAMDSMLAQPQALPMGAGGNTYYGNTTNSDTQVNNFNNLRNDQQVMQQMALLRTLRR